MGGGAVPAHMPSHPQEFARVLAKPHHGMRSFGYVRGGGRKVAAGGWTVRLAAGCHPPRASYARRGGRAVPPAGAQRGGTAHRGRGGAHSAVPVPPRGGRPQRGAGGPPAGGRCAVRRGGWRRPVAPFWRKFTPFGSDPPQPRLLNLEVAPAPPLGGGAQILIVGGGDPWVLRRACSGRLKVGRHWFMEQTNPRCMYVFGGKGHWRQTIGGKGS